jgi:23S rRNA pseudouridine1911/1915/1917 synthase
MPFDPDLDDDIDAEFEAGMPGGRLFPDHPDLDPGSHCGQRLDKVVAGLVPQFSRSRLQQWFERATSPVDGKPARGKDTAYGDETVLVRRSRRPKTPPSRRKRWR